ncbi:T9SS type A sorting domain-containing protein [Flavitalea sp. BT771]|uniref:T9SS type A sorting domain-containing protein n=1 Tax=Flavitalea sp. BT771 TaxID=3063329 RepID=UPI0026E1C366|nr:T9SS type A sorting domain-containing protein [Flavitalea sp. BT771]MDO6432565.1 T9SS type A sorting domain-containing protein [Flavitalea sp. BT771]MDV6222159.1 T9SS type A sorting domain-containing protein [Flavitalea sp. BT771]
MMNRNLSLWKNACLALCAGLLLHHSAGAQCANNLSSRTYDTLLTGPGYGTYQLSFPKWSIDSGLLVSVKVSAVVNVQYGFSLKNVDVMAGTYGLWVGREDMITSPSLPATYDNITEQKIGSYTLNPGDQVAVPPFPFLSNYANVDSFSAGTAPFLGAGNVNFTYSPITYTNIHASNNVSYSYHATASDVTRFSLTYIFCRDGVVLASGLTAFTAVAKDPGSVQLDWSAAAGAASRVYEVQRSRDGTAFATIGSRASVAGEMDYTYADRPGAGGKWYYRLRVVTPGEIAYSPIKEVVLEKGGGGKLVVYPNPAVDHINLVMPGDADAPGDWRVDICAADGRLVQRADFFHTNNFFINFRQQLSPGIYFVRASHLQSGSGQVTAFSVDAR